MKKRKLEANKLHSSRKRRNRKYTMTLCLMLLPGLVCLFLFNYLPMGLQGLQTTEGNLGKCVVWFKEL